MIHASRRLDVQLVASRPELVVQDGVVARQLVEPVAELEQDGPLVGAVVARNVVGHSGRRLEPNPVVHEELDPAEEGPGIRVPHRRADDRPGPAVRLDHLLRVIGVRVGVGLSDHDEGRRRRPERRRACLVYRGGVDLHQAYVGKTGEVGRGCEDSGAHGGDDDDLDPVANRLRPEVRQASSESTRSVSVTRRNAELGLATACRRRSVACVLVHGGIRRRRHARADG